MEIIQGKNSNLYFCPDKDGYSATVVVHQLGLIPYKFVRCIGVRIVINWTSRIFYVVNVVFNYDKLNESDADAKTLYDHSRSFWITSLDTFRTTWHTELIEEIKQTVFGPDWHVHYGWKQSHQRNALKHFAKYLTRSTSFNKAVCKVLAQHTFTPIVRPIAPYEITNILWGDAGFEVTREFTMNVKRETYIRAR